MLEIGSTLAGLYNVLAEIGQSGKSHVYLVLNIRAGKQWAAKEVSKTGEGEKDVISRHLIADAEILKGLKHDHIPTIVDVIETEEYYYILMDFIEGRTLQKVLEEEGAQNQEDVVKWGMQLCDVFIYLHSQDPPIIYRDTKPSNIMLTPDRDIVLIDFGAAREYKKYKTEDTLYLGTKGYAAPEQYQSVDGQSDERTDIYNVGATMYHLVTGHDPALPPYNLYPIRHWDKNLSSGLEQIILKCTKFNPDERYQSARELKYALEHYTQLDYEYRKRQRAKKRGMLIAFIMSLLCLAGAVLIGRQISRIENSSYESVMKSAKTATTKERAVGYYKEAIELKPASDEAYIDLLEKAYLEDGNFTQEEADEMTEILGDYPQGSRQTNEKILSQNSGYDRFAYEIGLAYFYYYNGTGNKQMAEPWFSIAAQSDPASNVLTENQRERALRLYKISSYYARLSIQNKAGDSEGSYLEYWQDMSALTEGNLVTLDNARTAYVMYKEITYQIRMHANDFRKAGVAKQELLEKLQSIEEHLGTDFTENLKEDYIDMIAEIGDNINAATRAVEIAYAGREG